MEGPSIVPNGRSPMARIDLEAAEAGTEHDQAHSETLTP
jgi:hypothetical protein